MRTTMSVVLAALVLAGFVAGCSDDESADTTTTAVESDGDATTTTGSEDDSSTGDSSGDGVGAFTSDECRQLAEAFDQAELGNAVANGEDPTEELERNAQVLSDAASQAPDEVRADIETLADYYDRLAAASADVDWDGIRSGNPSAIAGAAQFTQEFSSSDEVLTASRNLASWAQDNCVPSR